MRLSIPIPHFSDVLLALLAQYDEHGLYLTSVGRPSVCLSVCLSQLSQTAAAGLLLWARPAGDVDRLLYGAEQCGVLRENAGSATLSAHVGS